MLKRCVFVIGAMLLAHPVLAQPAAPARAAAAAIPTVEDRVSGLKKIDGYFPLYWEERTGSMLLEIPRFDTEFLFSTGLSAGLGSNDIGLDRGQGGQGRIVTFQRVGPRVMLVQGNQSFRSSSKNPLERKSVEDSFAKSVLWGFTVAAESNGDACWWTPPSSSCATCTAPAARLRPGTYRVDRTRSAFYLPNTKNFPKNTEIDMMLTFVNEAGGGGRGGGGGPAQGPAPIAAACGGRRVRPRRRPLLGLGGERHADARLGDAARARVVRRAAGRQLQDRASTIRAPATAASRFVDYSAPIGEPISHALHPPASPGEEGSVGGDQRAGEADPVLGGLGRAGRREEGADRGRELVEPGVRGRRLPQRVQGRGAARRRRPDGHPLQHDQLGAPLDARLELRRLGHRSAHRRDHQGHGHARLAARSAGLHDLRGPAVALRHRHREARRSSTRRRSRASASSPRTRSATRSASATTTTTAARAGSR